MSDVKLLFVLTTSLCGRVTSLKLMHYCSDCLWTLYSPLEAHPFKDIQLASRLLYFQYASDWVNLKSHRLQYVRVVSPTLTISLNPCAGDEVLHHHPPQPTRGGFDSCVRWMFIQANRSDVMCTQIINQNVRRQVY